jgi:ferrous iron transport protein A
MSAVLPRLERQELDSPSFASAVVRRPSLADLSVGQPAHIIAVAAASADVPADLIRRLWDLGFMPGEAVRVLARGPLGGEPIAVRIGTSTFALRRQEAACIQISP